MSCIHKQRSILTRDHISGRCQSDQQDLNTGIKSHDERLAACGSLRLQCEDANLLECRLLPTGGATPQETTQAYGAKASMTIEKHYHYQLSSEEDIYLAQTDKKQVDPSRLDDKVSQAVMKSKSQHDKNRRHPNQSKRIASKLSLKHYQPSDHHHFPLDPHQRGGTRYHSQLSCNLTHMSARQVMEHRCRSITANVPKARADIVLECSSERECDSPFRTCYENKCICGRLKPIEDRERMECLPHASLNESCVLNEQCIGNTICNDGFCLCPAEHISVFNPSTQLYYCHPKRGLRDECNFDAQCPANAFCSTKKYGCLCQNGYGPSLVKSATDSEVYACLPKACRMTSECESEYHQCDENKCKCLANHFDPHTAECYRFASTGGQLGDITPPSGNVTMLDDADSSKGTTSIINDLIKNGDKLWLIVIILAVLTLIFLAVLIILLRKHYLGYCWTRTKEYEPNSDSSPKSGQFDKNSINNKSFRRKNGDLDDEGEAIRDDTAADRSNLVTGDKNGTLVDNLAFVERDGGSGNENHSVRVDILGTSNDESDENQHLTSSPGSRYQRYHHQITTRPLPSSTSTPV